MILSDRSIREALAAGRIEIDPLDESCIQPSSVDLHLDRYFRVFRNHTSRVIDVKEDQENLTELVKVEPDEEPFILHPGEFVLGSTVERVKLPDDMVGRIEGKSSLGRLGLLIHSSLPAGERVMIRHEGQLQLVAIDDIVRKRLDAEVVSFDPETFEVGYYAITSWYEGPPDRIFEVVLASGRKVKVTAGHNLFTLDRSGELRKVRTGELVPGTMVAIPRGIPSPHEPGEHSDPTTIRVVALAPESAYPSLVVEGPAIASVFDERGPEVRRALRAAGMRHTDYYRRHHRLPLTVAATIPGLIGSLGADDRLGVRGGRWTVPAVITVDVDLAWTLGLYVAEGCRRRNQVTISNTDQAILDRAQRTCAALGAGVCRSAGAITATSGVLSMLVDWLDAGGKAVEKRVPAAVLGWPDSLLEEFVAGFVAGDGSEEETRISLWTSSPRLVDDMLYVLARLHRRASASFRSRPGTVGLHQVSVPHREHKLLTTVPLPNEMLIAIRRRLGLDQKTASEQLGFTHATDLNNVERRAGRDAVRLATLRRFQAAYGDDPRLDRLTNGGLLWDRVVEVRDTETWEAIYDIEVRPGGRKIENFVAGFGGVFVSNTAGFVDAGWDGPLTLELSNVANLPITLYPGMKIGQISFLQMTTPADEPYGSKALGSKYKGQRGPTPSRYFENFRRKAE